jgi:hypothetical protein
MAELFLELVADEGTAFHDLWVSIKKSARQVEFLFAANIKAGWRERGGDLSTGSDHLFIRVFHHPSPGNQMTSADP